MQVAASQGGCLCSFSHPPSLQHNADPAMYKLTIDVETTTSTQDGTRPSLAIDLTPHPVHTPCAAHQYIQRATTLTASKAPAARPEGGYVERVRARAQEVEGYGVAIGHAVLSGSAILNGLTDLNGLISFVWAFQRDNKIKNPEKNI